MNVKTISDGYLGETTTQSELNQTDLKRGACILAAAAELGAGAILEMAGNEASNSLGGVRITRTVIVNALLENIRKTIRENQK